MSNQNDSISRQALRQGMYHEAFEVDSDMQKWDGGCWIRYKLFEKIIDIMPSAQPEQKTGRWEHDGGYFANRWICSQCGYKFYFEKSEAKYCPNCGAKMESDNEV